MAFSQKILTVGAQPVKQAIVAAVIPCISGLCLFLGHIRQEILFVEWIFLQFPIKVSTGELLGEQRKFRVVKRDGSFPKRLHLIGFCADVDRTAQGNLIPAGAAEPLHDCFTALRCPCGQGGNKDIMVAPHPVGVVLQPVSGKAAHFHSANPRDGAGGQGQSQLRRKGLGILSIQLIEISHLKQHHMVGVSLLDGVVLHGGRLLALRHLLADKLIFILRHGLRGEVAVFAHQILNTVSDFHPGEIDFRAVSFGEADTLTVVVLMAVSRPGQGVGITACTVLLPQKVRLFLGVVRLLKEAVDPLRPALKVASARKGLVNLVLRDKGHDGGQFRQGGAEGLAGQVQFLQAVQHTTKIVVVKAHDRAIFLIGGKKCPVFVQQSFSEVRVCQKVGKAGLIFRKVQPFCSVGQAGKEIIRVIFPV